MKEFNYKLTFKKFLLESINDTGIFKAVFVVGLPAAGKSYTVARLSGTVSPRIVNTDKALEYLVQKHGIIASKDTWPLFKDSSLRITKNALFNYLNGMLPLFIDGTSRNSSKILNRIGILESLGYDVGMIYVNTPLEIALKRATERAKKIGRIVDEEFIKEVHSTNESNVRFLRSKVQFFEELKTETDVLSDDVITNAFKKTQKFFLSPINNPVGVRNVNLLRKNKEKFLVPTVIKEENLMKKVESWYD